MAFALQHLVGDDGLLWIPLRQAALKLGCNDGALRRKCVKSLKYQGHAKAVNGQWYVHVSYDSRLVDRKHWRQADLLQLAELSARGLAPKYIEIAKRRSEILRGLDAYRPCGNPGERDRITMYLADRRTRGLSAISITQFYQWRSAFESEGLPGLVPAFAWRSSEQTGGAIGDAALDYLDRLLNCGNRITVAAALAIARGESQKHTNDPSWRIGSYRSVLLAVEKRRPKIMKILSDKGEKSATANCVPKIIRDTESVAAGDEYVGDERTIDIWVRVLTSRGWRPVRPKLTAWLDLRSRVMVGWIVRAHADSNTILASLKRAIQHYGKPITIRTDWGEDYRHATKRPEYREFNGERIGSVLDALGIEFRRTAGPYMPWAKPIESFFKTMKTQFDVLHNSFWGGCPSERHEDRQEYLRENLEKLPTLEEFEMTLTRFFSIYHATRHGATDLFGKTPMEAMAAFRERPVARESESVLAHLFRTFTAPKIVRRDGIRHLGHWYGNGDARLVRMQGRGKKVLLAIDVDDASRAMVCELDRTPMFEIELLNVRGMSVRELKERIRQQKRILRPFKEEAKDARAFILSKTPDEILRLRAAGLGIPTPSPVKGEGRGEGGSPCGTGVTPVNPAPVSLRLRTNLEEAIDKAGPAPSDTRQARALKNGTDDESISLDDMIDPFDMTGPAADVADDDDGMTLADLAGEHFDD